MKVATWNIAAINNNPWEYWITYDRNPKYTKLMVDVEEFMENPGDKDVAVKEIFTQEMFEKLYDIMNKEGWNGLEEVRRHWNENYQNRKIIAEFMKDATIGAKRLASMPDRITNTINIELPEGSNNNEVPFICRPTVINQYEGDLSTLEVWFTKWCDFLFFEQITLKTRKGVEKKRIAELLQKIEHSKYPAITEEEEAISIPLQTLCIAIFDCILVHMMITLAKDDWQEIKSDLTSALNKQKVQRTAEILSNVYGEMEIVFLQEVASAFTDQAKAYFSAEYQKNIVVLHPKNLDYSRDQNSMILLNTNVFEVSTVEEITEQVVEFLKNTNAKKVPIAVGDLFAITVADKQGRRFLIASFHGDTDGLATIPVVTAVDGFAKQNYADHLLVFGLDANSYEKPHPSRLSVVQFAEDFVSKGLTSCYGDHPDPTNYTTFNARTFLQAQLNKACRSVEIREKGDINPKDFILFYKTQMNCSEWSKDNTGEKRYVDAVFPTLTFPSDHAVLSANLCFNENSKI